MVCLFWIMARRYGGSPSSFLFSVDKDVMIPYHGRVKGPYQAQDEMLRQQHDAEQANEIANIMYQRKVRNERSPPLYLEATSTHRMRHDTA